MSLYKIGESYFVLDGNHRVSVARYHGVQRTDARVIEYGAYTKRPALQPSKQRNRPGEEVVSLGILER